MFRGIGYDTSALWIAESDEEVYVVTYKGYIRNIQLYAPKNGESEKVILLYKSEDGIATVDIGAFSHENALRFVEWLQNSENAVEKTSAKG